MPAGGRITVTTGQDGGDAFLAVADRGEGVPAVVRERLGEPPVSPGGKGLRGLGLSMCWRIAEAHGGRIAVESTPGRGSVFTLWLPASADVPTDMAAAVARAPRGQVLVVDDDEDVRIAVSGMLAVLGWSVTTAAGADEALSTLAATRVDAVMTDFAMPGRTGLDLARQLRLLGLATPVALFSGVATHFHPETLGDVQLVVAKPLTLESLARTLETLVADPGLLPPTSH